jgi:hypothetical protein
MEYARLIIISSSVGDFLQSWLFHLLLFINSLLIFSGINACFAGIFYWSHVIINLLLIFKGVNENASLVTHSLLIFIGIRELKVRQFDYNIIFGW